MTEPSTEVCKCDIRTKLVGDGCQVCNPEKAVQYMSETIADQKAEIATLEGLLRECSLLVSSPPFATPEYINHLTKRIKEATK